MSDWWATDERLMSDWWATDEWLMSDWWATNERLMSDWWATDEWLMSDWLMTIYWWLGGFDHVRTYARTHRRTTLVVKSLSRLKIISVRNCILEIFFTYFWQALSNLWRLFLAHLLVESKGILSQLSKMVQHLYFCWRNKGSRVPNIFNTFSIKFHVFLNHSKSDVFHPP